MEETKKCVSCGEVKDICNFGTRKNKHKSKCNSCLNKEDKKRERNKRKTVIDYLGGCCQICERDDYIEVLQFHHVDPSQKDKKYHQMRSWALKRILVEANKCVLLCNCCHTIVHVELRLGNDILKKKGIYSHNEKNHINMLSASTPILIA